MVKYTQMSFKNLIKTISTKLKVVIITGDYGSGKTTFMNNMRENMKDIDFKLCSPSFDAYSYRVSNWFVKNEKIVFIYNHHAYHDLHSIRHLDALCRFSKIIIQDKENGYFERELFAKTKGKRGVVGASIVITLDKYIYDKCENKIGEHILVMMNEYKSKIIRKYNDTDADKEQAALTIQKYWDICRYNPQYQICKNILLRECEEIGL